MTDGHADGMVARGRAYKSRPYHMGFGFLGIGHIGIVAWKGQYVWLLIGILRASTQHGFR